MKKEIVDFFKSLQDSICNALEKLDGKAKFLEDLWQRGGGGGGRTRVIVGGDVFEKGGVNFSEVYGKAPAFLAKEIGATGEAEFFASGVSIVIHPRSPMVPIIHMNVRFLALGSALNEAKGAFPPSGETGKGAMWFGGGIDLTPIYVVEEDARQFHKMLKEVCDRSDAAYYERFKKWADDYFFITHRNETRGVGGIFFDHLKPKNDAEFETLFSFVRNVGNTFIPAYSPIVNKSKSLHYSEKEKKWQLLRRGRYAEFNLVYDRGTKFGLETSGRTESILMSLPPEVNWDYNSIPAPGSAEAKTLALLKKGHSWAG